MSRNASGVYTLASGNPVVTGTFITTTWANATLPDLATEMTDSLSRSGKGGMLTPLKKTNGSVGAPSDTFTNDLNSGTYLAETGDVRVTVAGADKMRFRTNGVEVFLDGIWQLLDPSAGVGLPPEGNKNLLINGAFDVWQRGVSFGFIDNGEYLADRWQLETKADSVERHVFSGTEPFAYGIKLARTGSVTSVSIQQKIESINAVHTIGEKLTLAFTVNAVPGKDLPNSLSVALRTANAKDDFSATTLVQFIGGSAPLDGERVEYNFTTPMPSDARNGFLIEISNGSDPGAEWIYSGVQLEIGTTATGFKNIPVADTLAACQRYFQTTLTGSSSAPPSVFEAANVASAWGTMVFPTPARVIPAVKVYSYNETVDKISEIFSTSDFAGSAVVNTPSAEGFSSITTDSAMVVGDMYRFKYTADAEL